MVIKLTYKSPTNPGTLLIDGIKQRIRDIIKCSNTFLFYLFYSNFYSIFATDKKVIRL